MSKQTSNYQENVKKGLDYLKGSDRIVGDIINYCVNEYKQSPTPKSIGIVQKYLQDTADSVSDHVLNIAHNISKMLEQQVREIELLNYDTQFITHRLSISESYMSSLMMTKFQTYPRPRKTIHILRKTLPDEQLPKSARRRAAWKRQTEFNYKLLDKVGKNVVSTDYSNNQSGTKQLYHQKRESQSMSTLSKGISSIGPQNPPPPTFSSYQSSSNVMKNTNEIRSNNSNKNQSQPKPKPQPTGEGEGSPGSPVSPPNPPKPPQPFSQQNNGPPNPPKPPQPFSIPNNSPPNPPKPPQPFSGPPNPPNPPKPPQPFSQQNNGPPNPPKPPQPFSQPKPKPFNNNNNNNNNGPPQPPKPPQPPNMGGPPPVPKTGGPPPVPNMGGPPKPPNPPNVGGPPPPPNMGGGPPPVPNMGGPPPVPQGNNNNQVPEEFKPYVKMLNMGVPRVAVNGKMSREGYDPSELDQYL